MASYLHRTATTIYPCCIPALGEFNRSWSYKTCRRKNRGIGLIDKKRNACFIAAKNKTCFGIINEYWRVSNYLMKRKLPLSLFALVTLFILSSCDAIKNLPTNTTGGVFSLNGTWRLTSSNDNNAMSGTTITVYPVVGNATVKTIGNSVLPLYF